MQQSEGSAERSEWQSKQHLNLWPEPTRKRRPLPKRISPRQFRDFCRRPDPAGNPGRRRDGRAVISAVAPASFQAAMRSSFPFQIAVAPGCEHFSVPIFALAMNTRFLFIPKRTMTLAYLGLSIRMTCMSTIQRPVGGGGCEANFWSRLVKSSEPASFCSRAIPETHSFRTTSK